MLFAKITLADVIDDDCTRRPLDLNTLCTNNNLTIPKTKFPRLMFPLLLC